MQISLQWINELVELETIKLEELIDRLTFGGFEVEDILEIPLSDYKTTTALEISSTANRSDSLSIQGLSLEVSALLNQIPKKLKYSEKTSFWAQKFGDIEPKNNISEECLGFIGISIENVNDFTSPKWLQQKLLASGLPVENNLLDFQNYILFETGYPIEVYDLDQIYSKAQSSKVTFSLSRSNKPFQFSASNGKVYNIDKSVSLIQANNQPISIAGIISENNVLYSSRTKTLFVEASIFHAATIRQQSRILGLRTDRSSRYEKSLKNIALLESIQRFILLLRIANPKLRCKLNTITRSCNEIATTIQLDYTKVKQVLGPIKSLASSQIEYISPQIITDTLKRLQFKVDYNNFKWNVTVPALRADDIVREIDIIEEIGRIYGFDNFLTRLPAINQVGNEDFDYQTRKKLTSGFINLGLNELIQYSLVNEKTYLKNEVELINPLGKDYSNLRSSLLPNLLKSTAENLKKGNLNLEGFEYGHIFLKNSQSKIIEHEVVAGILGGYKRRIDWTSPVLQLNWFEAKGKLEQLFQKLNIITYWEDYKPLKERNILHAYCSAQIRLADSTQIGVFGQVSPILANKLNIPTDIYIFELDFNLIKNQIQQNQIKVYKEYSFYPKIIKDLSFIVKNNISFEIIQKLLLLNGSSFLKSIVLLDKYQGKSIPANHTSLCLQLVFQSNYETLQNYKIETIINNLIKILKTKLNVIIRI